MGKIKQVPWNPFEWSSAEESIKRIPMFCPEEGEEEEKEAAVYDDWWID